MVKVGIDFGASKIIVALLSSKSKNPKLYFFDYVFALRGDPKQLFIYKPTLNPDKHFCIVMGQHLKLALSQYTYRNRRLISHPYNEFFMSDFTKVMKFNNLRKENYLDADPFILSYNNETLEVSIVEMLGLIFHYIMSVLRILQKGLRFDEFKVSVPPTYGKLQMEILVYAIRYGFKTSSPISFIDNNSSSILAFLKQRRLSKFIVGTEFLFIDMGSIETEIANIKLNADGEIIQCDKGHIAYFGVLAYTLTLLKMVYKQLNANEGFRNFYSQLEPYQADILRIFLFHQCERVLFSIPHTSFDESTSIFTIDIPHIKSTISIPAKQLNQKMDKFYTKPFKNALEENYPITDNMTIVLTGRSARSSLIAHFIMKHLKESNNVLVYTTSQVEGTLLDPTPVEKCISFENEINQSPTFEFTTHFDPKLIVIAVDKDMINDITKLKPYQIEEMKQFYFGMVKKDREATIPKYKKKGTGPKTKEVLEMHREEGKQERKKKRKMLLEERRGIVKSPPTIKTPIKPPTDDIKMLEESKIIPSKVTEKETTFTLTHTQDLLRDDDPKKAVSVTHTSSPVIETDEDDISDQTPELEFDDSELTTHSSQISKEEVYGDIITLDRDELHKLSKSQQVGVSQKQLLQDYDELQELLEIQESEADQRFLEIRSRYNRLTKKTRKQESENIIRLCDIYLQNYSSYNDNEVLYIRAALNGQSLVESSILNLRGPLFAHQFKQLINRAAKSTPSVYFCDIVL